jgi:hypothetical protein
MGIAISVSAVIIVGLAGFFRFITPWMRGTRWPVLHAASLSPVNSRRGRKSIQDWASR